MSVSQTVTRIRGHMGRNSIETSAMLAAIKELEKKVSWQAVR